MVSAHNEQATAATRRNWCRADPRAYIRIAAVLRERITAGDLAPGQAMPSITRLCADHGVARQTAAHALHVLQDAGLVYRVPGLGYHVCNAILSQPSSSRSRATPKTAPTKGDARVGGTSLACLTVRQPSNGRSLVL
jgi:DNA-binding GntR family transcriptional regulator